MSRYLVGTASWTDKSLIDCGRFYPRKTMSAQDRLRFYASRFPMVEVDSSYYAIPAPQTAQLWAERTPEGFEFNVKAFRLFTGHATPQLVLHQDLRQAFGAALPDPFHWRDAPDELIDELWRRQLDALAPLRAAGKLTAVHFQFAPWVVRSAPWRDHVADCVRRMADHLVAVEFRHASWFHGAQVIQDTLDFERSLGVVHTVVDAPQGFANTVPAVWEVTRRELAILRLHGRNRATWNVRGATSAADRFNYLYEEQELADLVPPLRALGRHAQKVHVIFNNNMEDQGQVCAARMAQLLGQADG
ncbi:DUF72 domain-containing protein [Ramlibacter rhizophilus]|uniref:DUF72 domain-containing protein n=1 Tax=Ramlibacter rhizophilus TaxID=1781167 RepID=A0A4Z0BDI7_9BURK|nr:DUF72 domain-containing protein [Ramlibacter rhizophilus]TFY96860.1 DUF72 domain-containing protein [Ramlibacter rhizophilus]